MNKKVKNISVVALLVILSFIAIFPFIWMIFSSFKENTEFYQVPPSLLPKKFQLSNFIDLNENFDFTKYYLNSIFVTFVQVISNIVIVLLAGYGFAKFKFKMRGPFFSMILASTMVPWVATIIPLYIMANKAGLIDSYLGLIIPGMADAFSIFLARNFIAGIPDPLLEAARMDGANELTIFRKIVLPSCKPIIAVITITKLVASWNAFQWPLLAVNSEKYRTVPLAISLLSGQYNDAYNLKLAAAAAAVIPILIVYIAFQKYFVEGVSLSGIK
ncbi:carbohydrate ABC transporter permease [Enterococcus massiliensis]|uniref:carbohydrate ABC transporter permease n=1 Tax=Enterococcus massiliensis TaxID=1640685 RepID=UPI00065E5B47|nr:carbohydrate ABC transporter permease [Enterococcus massiliensis]